MSASAPAFQAEDLDEDEDLQVVLRTPFEVHHCLEEGGQAEDQDQAITQVHKTFEEEHLVLGAETCLLHLQIASQIVLLEITAMLAGLAGTSPSPLSGTD